MSAPEGRSPYPSAAQPTGPEWELAEKPLIDQLTAMGWTLAEHTGRTSLREAVLELPLRAALRRINPDDDGREWLDESRLGQAVSALTRPQSRTLIEINEELTGRSEEHTSELQSRGQLVCRLLLEKKKRRDSG